MVAYRSHIAISSAANKASLFYFSAVHLMHDNGGVYAERAGRMSASLCVCAEMEGESAKQQQRKRNEANQVIGVDYCLVECKCVSPCQTLDFICCIAITKRIE